MSRKPPTPSEGTATILAILLGAWVAMLTLGGFGVSVGYWPTLGAVWLANFVLMQVRR